MNTGELLTINEAAEIKGVTRQAIHAAISDGRLEAIEVMLPSKRITRGALEVFQPNPNMKRCGPRPKPPKAKRRKTVKTLSKTTK